jgi:FixJ family two-component response regulator
MARNDELEQSVFVVDDEPRVCEAIRETLEAPSVKITCFNSGLECLMQLGKHKCDLLITDLKMPQMDGVELLTKARAIAPWLPVLMITGYGDIPTAIKAIKAGVVDFIEKPLVKKSFVRQVKSLLQESVSLNAHVGTPLTRGETRVLKLIVDGRSNKDIANLLHRSVRTVEVHRSRVMEKLDVENIIDLVKRAATMGLIDLPTGQTPDETA